MAYVDRVQHLSDIERTSTTKEKTGEFTGRYCINPLNGKRVPIFISDYVLMDYGTGAIMAVPSHDQRDFDFAKAFDLEIIPVVDPERDDIDLDNLTEAFEAEGKLINSGKFNGMNNKEAIVKITEYLEEQGIGEKRQITNWGLAHLRQRYWELDPDDLLRGLRLGP